jgi:hypothetical protein
MNHIPPGKVLSDRSADITAAEEYKDRPITFMLYDARGRQLEIKIVEPELEYPLPENDRLVVSEKDDCITDVVFKFNPESDHPYELNFSILMGTEFESERLFAFGIPLEDDKDLLSQYDMEIINQGGVKAWIKMTQGKARVFIKYNG